MWLPLSLALDWSRSREARPQAGQRAALVSADAAAATGAATWPQHQRCPSGRLAEVHRHLHGTAGRQQGHGQQLGPPGASLHHDAPAADAASMRCQVTTQHYYCNYCGSTRWLCCALARLAGCSTTALHPCAPAATSHTPSPPRAVSRRRCCWCGTAGPEVCWSAAWPGQRRGLQLWRPLGYRCLLVSRSSLGCCCHWRCCCLWSRVGRTACCWLWRLWWPPAAVWLPLAAGGARVGGVECWVVARGSGLRHVLLVACRCAGTLALLCFAALHYGGDGDAKRSLPSGCNESQPPTPCTGGSACQCQVGLPRGAAVRVAAWCACAQLCSCSCGGRSTCRAPGCGRSWGSARWGAARLLQGRGQQGAAGGNAAWLESCLAMR